MDNRRKVKRGDKKRKKIGFPTCNLDIEKLYNSKTWSIFSKILIGNKTKKKGIVNVGYRPTFGKKRLNFEVIFLVLKKIYMIKELK